MTRTKLSKVKAYGLLKAAQIARDPLEEALFSQLKASEGYRPTWYTDNKTQSIGYGHARSGNRADLILKHAPRLKNIPMEQWNLKEPEAANILREQIKDKIQEARGLAPAFDKWPMSLRLPFVKETYRGMVPQSKRTLSFVNSGNFSGAAKEYINASDYKKGGSIQQRMQELSDAFREYALQASMKKESKPRGVGDIRPEQGPEQLVAAIGMMDRARLLAMPSDDLLKSYNLKREDFERELKALRDKKEDRYDFRAMVPNVKEETISGAIAGGLAGSVPGAVAIRASDNKAKGFGLALLMSALGAGGGALTGRARAMGKRKRLLATAKILKQYGLLRPEHLRRAYPLLTEEKYSSQEFYPVKFVRKGEKVAEAKIELADTPEKCRKGLSSRKDLEKDAGMLFTTSGPFWMKDTKIPLEVLFLSKEGKVLDYRAMPVHTDPSTEMPKYATDKSGAVYAIELPMGWSSEAGVFIGDQVVLNDD
jgi:uncharacterized membrane protein (UPF0127 family)